MTAEGMFSLVRGKEPPREPSTMELNVMRDFLGAGGRKRRVGRPTVREVGGISVALSMTARTDKWLGEGHGIGAWVFF